MDTGAGSRMSLRRRWRMPSGIWQPSRSIGCTERSQPFQALARQSMIRSIGTCCCTFCLETSSLIEGLTLTAPSMSDQSLLNLCHKYEANVALHAHMLHSCKRLPILLADCKHMSCLQIAAGC